MNHRRSRRVNCACALAVVSIALGRVAHAQTAQDVAARRLLLRQAEQARDGGDHARALELADRAGRIQMTPSVRMFIAQEQAAVGQVAAALGNADLCVHEAERDTGLVSRGTIRENCHRLVTSLGARVGRVTVRVPSPAPQGLTVNLAGNSLSDAFWGVPYAVDPGSVRVEASAPGYIAFQQDVQVTAGQSMDVTVTLSAEPPPAPEPTPAPSVEPAPATPPPAPVEPVALPPVTVLDGNSHVPASAILIGSFGVAGAATAIVFYELASTRGGTLAANCTMDHVCDDTVENRSAYSDARTYTIVGDVAVGVAGVGLAAAVALWLTAPSPHGTAAETRPTVRALLAPTPGGAMLTVGGTL